MNEISRRRFIGSVAAAGAVAVSAGAAEAAPRRQATSAQPARPQAPGGRVLKAGLIGCGGRGRGAALNFLDAGPNLQITALADVFPDRVAKAREILNGQRGQDIPESRGFTGFDAYKKLLDSGVDLVIHATPPHFRPMHMAAVVDARKHLFMEKPVAVDVPGVKAVMQTAERAASLGLSVMTGTQLRRDTARMEVWKRVRDAARRRSRQPAWAATRAGAPAISTTSSASTTSMTMGSTCTAPSGSSMAAPMSGRR